MSDESDLWITNAIVNQHIQLFDYIDFIDKTDCKKGGFAEVICANWARSDRKVALKKLERYDVQKFVQEVLFFFFL